MSMNILDVEDDEGSISETESEEESDEESSEEESSSEEEVKKVRRPTKDQFDSESEVSLYWLSYTVECCYKWSQFPSKFS